MAGDSPSAGSSGDPVTVDRDLAEPWPLDRNVVFLNHGSFGACPREVLRHQAALRDEMETQPVRFLSREITIGAPATQWWINLSTAMVFGLGFATVLTLIVTPAALMLVENLRNRRLAWSARGGRLTHHNASVQVFADGARRCRLVWIADLLPNELAGDIRAMIDQAAAVMKKTLDGR